MDSLTPSSRSVPPALYDTSASSGSGSLSGAGASGTPSGKSRRKFPQHFNSYDSQHPPQQSSFYPLNEAMNDAYATHPYRGSSTHVPSPSYSKSSRNNEMYQRQYHRSEESSQHYRNDYSRSQHGTLRHASNDDENAGNNRHRSFSPVAQSEPNYPTSDEARFSAYVNRFAAYDRGSSRPQRHYVPAPQESEGRSYRNRGQFEGGSFNHKSRHENSTAAGFLTSPESLKTPRSAPIVTGHPQEHTNDGYYNHNHHHPPNRSPPQQRMYRASNSEPGWHDHEFEHENPHNNMMHLPLDPQQQQQQHEERYYHGDGGSGISPNSIESPPRRTVTEIKRSLWGDEDDLQVSVRSSLHGHGDSHPRDWLHYEGPELAGRGGFRTSRSLSPGRRQYRNHEGWEDNHNNHIHDDRENFVHAPIPSQRRSSSAGRSQHRLNDDDGQQEDHRHPPLNYTDHRHNHQEAAPAFKSRYYQAAMAAQRVGENQQDQFVQRKSNSERSHRRSFLQPFDHINEHPSHRNMPQEEAEQGDISSLVAKLNAAQMDGEDPGKALKKINAILRAESSSIASSSQHRHGVSVRGVRNTKLPEREQQQQPVISDESQESSGDESEDTSVSSITDPSYAAGKPSLESIQDTMPPKQVSMSNFRRPRPSGLEAYNNGRHGMATQTNMANHRGVLVSKESSSGPLPPPSAIKVNGGASKTTTSKTGEQLHKLDAHLNSSRNQQHSAAAIALKIQKWDEMSDPEFGRDQNQNQTQNKNTGPISGQTSFEARQGSAIQIVSPSSSFNESTPGTVNTEDLGSIMTPLDEKDHEIKEEDYYARELLKPATSVGRSTLAQRRSHPWDNTVKDRDRQQVPDGNGSVGAESNGVFELSEGGSVLGGSLGGTSGSPDKSFVTRSEKQEHANSMSEQFDDAWVALPSSSFFPAKDKANSQQKAVGISNNLEDGDYGPKKSKARHNVALSYHRNADSLNSTQSSITSSIKEAFSGKDDLLDDVPAAATVGTNRDINTNHFGNVDVPFYDSPITKGPPDAATEAESSEIRLGRDRRRKGVGLFGNRNGTVGGTPLLCGSRPDDSERHSRRSARSVSKSRSPGRRRSVSKSKSPGRRWFGNKKPMGHI